MGDDYITENQVTDMLKKITGGSLDYSAGGFKNKGVTGVGAYVEYRQPLIDQKLDVVIKGAGHYVDWGTGHHKGIDYKGIELQYNF